MAKHDSDDRSRRIPIGETPDPFLEDEQRETRRTGLADTAPLADMAQLTPMAQIAELKVCLEEAEDGRLRAVAEVENTRKRFDRNLIRERQIERERVLLAWLEIVDNMERALEAEGASGNPWARGMRAIYQQMLAVLKRFDVVPFDALGEVFHPERHEAIATSDDPDLPDGAVVEVAQTGYKMEGRIFRPAKVVAIKHTA